MPNTLGSRLAKTIGPDRRWVLPQLALLAGVIVAGCSDWQRRGRPRPSQAVTATSLALLASAVRIVLMAKRDLSESFTMSPSPVEQGALVDRGIYGVVRHPMYLSVLLFLTGFTLLLRSVVAGAGSAIASAYFLAKIAVEERKLLARYSDYAAYRRRVRWRLIPGVL